MGRPPGRGGRARPGGPQPAPGPGSHEWLAGPGAARARAGRARAAGDSESAAVAPGPPASRRTRMQLRGAGSRPRAAPSRVRPTGTGSRRPQDPAVCGRGAVPGEGCGGVAGLRSVAGRPTPVGTCGAVWLVGRRTPGRGPAPAAAIPLPPTRSGLAPRRPFAGAAAPSRNLCVCEGGRERQAGRGRKTERERERESGGRCGGREWWPPPPGGHHSLFLSLSHPLTHHTHTNTQKFSFSLAAAAQIIRPPATIRVGPPTRPAPRRRGKSRPARPGGARARPGAPLVLPRAGGAEAQ